MSGSRLFSLESLFKLTTKEQNTQKSFFRKKLSALEDDLISLYHFYFVRLNTNNRQSKFSRYSTRTAEFFLRLLGRGMWVSIVGEGYVGHQETAVPLTYYYPLGD